MQAQQHPDNLPFVAPCRRLSVSAPFRWLKAGWADYRNSRGRSLAYGVVMALLSLGISWLAWRFGNLGLLLGLLSGFVFLGPLLAITLYAVSDQLQRGESPTFRGGLRAARRSLGNALVFATVLLVIFLVWARAASMLHVFFPDNPDTATTDLMLFLGIGSAVGAVFAAIVFLASAFSLPMLLDRQADSITCVLTSANAVLRNKPTMLLWSTLIVLSVLIGVATAFVGFIVLLPVIGHATWHAYRETIDAGAWPEWPREESA